MTPKCVDDGTRKLNEDLAAKLMIIRNRKNIGKDILNIHINNTKLRIEDNLKYLGIVVDDKLSFNENVNYVAHKDGKENR